MLITFFVRFFIFAEPQALRLYMSVSVTRPVCRAAMFAAQNLIKIYVQNFGFSNEFLLFLLQNI